MDNPLLFCINRKFFFLFFQTKDLRSTVTREACVTLRSEPAFAYDANHIFPSQLLCLILNMLFVSSTAICQQC